MLAFSYQHIWFSQNARGYTMMGFFALLSTVLPPPGRRIQAGFRLRLLRARVCGGNYTHLTMAFVVAGHVVVMAGGKLVGWQATREPAFKSLLMAWAAAAVLSLALYAPYGSHMLAHLSREEPGRQAAQFATRRWAVLEVVRNLVSGAGALGALMIALAAAVGALSLLWRRPLEIALLLVPTVVAAVAVVVLGYPMRPRFFFSSPEPSLSSPDVASEPWQNALTRPHRRPRSLLPPQFCRVVFHGWAGASTIACRSRILTER